MKKMTGGRTNYGETVGILMLNTSFPRFPGDIGNATTFPFPIRYKTIEQASLADVMTKDPNMSLLYDFIKAAKELEQEGVKVITTSCGYLAPYQKSIANAVHIPVVTSSLMMVPFIHQMINQDQTIAIFTEAAENMNNSYFIKTGWSTDQIPVVVKGMPNHYEFSKVYSHDKEYADWDELASEMVSITNEHMQSHPNTGAIVFECTNMGSFAEVVHKASGVPVFGINNLIEFAASSVKPKSYSG